MIGFLRVLAQHKFEAHVLANRGDAYDEIQ